MRVAALLLIVALAGCLGGADEPEPVAPGVALDITWTPEVPDVGEEVLFHVDIASNQPGDELRRIDWVIGSIPYIGNDIVHRFHREGGFTVQATVETALTGITSTQEQVVVGGDGATPPDPSGPPDTPPTPPDPVTPDTPLSIVTVVQGKTVGFSYRWGQEAEQVHWDFGDGGTSDQNAPLHTYATGGTYTVSLRAISDVSIDEAQTTVAIVDDAEPYVVVGVVDSGINPYHEIYHRPDLTAHPCTYVEDYPCDIPALHLSVGPGQRSWQDAFSADADEWKKAKEGKWFWIPRTNLIAVGCHSVWDAANGDQCILDDSDDHGTHTTSSVLMENPDALIAFAESSLVSGVSAFASKRLPIDVLSLSLGFGGVPLIGLPAAPAPAGLCSILLQLPENQIIVQSSGNAPGLSILLDCWSGDPRLITVGGGSAASNGQEAMAYKDMDLVSYFCRPAASTRSLSGITSEVCGTSFSTPTVAGALSKVILDLRRESGHLGGTEGKYVDPILKVTKAELRTAMNLTATYDPSPKYSNGCSLFGAGACIPVNPAAPWTQWGWGFYDGDIADATTAYLLGEQGASKSAAAVAHQEGLYLLREALYG